MINFFHNNRFTIMVFLVLIQLFLMCYFNYINHINFVAMDNRIAELTKNVEDFQSLTNYTKTHLDIINNQIGSISDQLGNQKNDPFVDLFVRVICSKPVVVCFCGLVVIACLEIFKS